MIRRPPRATRITHSFPTRRSSDLYATLSEALDAHLPRIAPASALLGDIIEIEGDGPLGSMGVYVGNGRIFCYHELHDVPVIFQPVAPIRSEEHTSELQSLMRISYAVFCLKKKMNPAHAKHSTTSN